VTRAAAIALGLALCLCTGCFIFDEIDQGRKLMKKHSGQRLEHFLNSIDDLGWGWQYFLPQGWHMQRKIR
jgi:hypothetical protein